ncbi:MAG: hypothetical protein MHM6MM_003865 [Cercozoa sp. M6MM]
MDDLPPLNPGEDEIYADHGVPELRAQLSTQSTVTHAFHLAYVVAAPLVHMKASGKVEPVPRIDVAAELAQLHEILAASNRAVTMHAAVGTSRQLRTLMTLGCRALHYSGHGLQGSGALALEDDDGRLHALHTRTLAQLLAAGAAQGGGGLQFAFVSSCHSEAAAQALVSAGVPHVVAVRRDQRVSDVAARRFATQFYLALLVGHSVRASFDIAVAAVAASDRDAVAREKNKFLLLPKHAAHDNAVFADLPVDSRWQDLSPPPPLSQLPPLPEHFVGRQVDTQRVFVAMRQHRCVALMGVRGVGKSALATAVAHYALQRERLDGLYVVNVAAHAQQLKQRLSSLTRLVQAEMHRAAATRGHAAPRTSSDFFDDVRAQRVWLVLDLPHAHDLSEDVWSFVSELLRRVPYWRVLLTAPLTEQCVASTGEEAVFAVTVPRLPPREAARLFIKCAPRTLSLDELPHAPSGGDGDVLTTIAFSRTLQKLGGRPALLLRAARLLRQHKFDAIEQSGDPLLRTVLGDLLPKTRLPSESNASANSNSEEGPRWPRHFDDFARLIAGEVTPESVQGAIDDLMRRVGRSVTACHREFWQPHLKDISADTLRQAYDAFIGPTLQALHRCGALLSGTTSDGAGAALIAGCVTRHRAAHWLTQTRLHYGCPFVVRVSGTEPGSLVISVARGSTLVDPNFRSSPTSSAMFAVRVRERGVERLVKAESLVALLRALPHLTHIVTASSSGNVIVVDMVRVLRRYC